MKVRKLFCFNNSGLGQLTRDGLSNCIFVVHLMHGEDRGDLRPAQRWRGVARARVAAGAVSCPSAACAGLPTASWVIGAGRRNMTCVTTIDWAATGSMLQGIGTLAGVGAVIWGAKVGANTWKESKAGRASPRNG